MPKRNQETSIKGGAVTQAQRVAVGRLAQEAVDEWARYAREPLGGRDDARGISEGYWQTRRDEIPGLSDAEWEAEYEGVECPLRDTLDALFLREVEARAAVAWSKRRERRGATAARASNVFERIGRKGRGHE